MAYRYLPLISAFAIVLALFGAPVSAQTTASSGTMETWKLIAIIVPSVVGGLTILSVLFFCCCCRAHYNGGMCGDCNGSAGCCGPRGGCDCGPGAGCDCGPGGCCGPRGGCHCGPGGACDCGDCCGDCCYDGRHHNQRTVYSSSQGPIQVQPAYQGRAYSAPQPAPQTYFSDPTYVSSLPVGPKYGGGVYGGAPRAPVYGSGPVVRGGGCGC